MPSLRLLALSALLAAPNLAFAGYNPPPDDCCQCIRVTVDDKEKADGPDKNPIHAAAEGNGDYTLKNLLVEVKSTDECSNVQIAKITLQPKSTGNGDSRDNSCDVDVPVTNPKIVSYPTFTIPGSKIGRYEKDVWLVVVKCTGLSASTNSATVDYCTYPFTLGEGCSSCSSGTCSITGGVISASNGCFTCDMSLGVFYGGDATGSLRFFTPDMSFPGLAGIGVSAPSWVNVVRTLSNPSAPPGPTNPIISITISTPTAIVVAVPTVSKTNSITITHKHKVGGDVFRTTFISLVNNCIRVDSTYDNSTYRYQQSLTKSDVGVTPAVDTYTLESGAVASPDSNSFSSNVREETLAITYVNAGVQTHHETVREKNVPVSNGALVSEIISTWEYYPFGWEKTKQVIDPSGAKLTSTWDYYQPGESTIGGYGRLKRYIRYDGYEEFHTYQFNAGKDIHITQSPFAGDRQGLTLTSTWDSSARTLTTTRTVNGSTLSAETKTFNEANTTITATTKTSSGASITTTTELMPYGADFGGQPSSIAHPDGTWTTYAYATPRQDDGGKTVTVKNGSISTPSVNGGTLTYGTTTITIYNANGTPVLRTATLTVPNAGTVTTESFEVTQQDAFGRAVKTSYFPSGNTKAWEILTRYSCCGISSTTDRHGVETTYTYDGLRRQISSSTLGVTTETDYSGLTTTTKRNSEVIAVSVRNLAGTYRESWSPNPAATADVPLVAT
ncbi:MAG: hypothetical protein WCO57_16875, partial [Verrucomicrobiota bacterium]